MQHLSSSSSSLSKTSFHTVKKSVNIIHRTVIPDDLMRTRLAGYVTKIRSGSDFDISLLNCTFELNALDTIQPIIDSGIVEAIFDCYDTFTEQQKSRILPILSTISSTTYKNVIVSTNLEDLMRILKLEYNESTMKKVLDTIKEYLELDESITEKILKLGGLEIILEACSSINSDILFVCSKMILYIVLFGGKSSVQMLMKSNLNAWILPLVHIYEDNRIRYYAFFSLVYIRSIHKINHDFFEYGLMDNNVHWLSENEIHLRSCATLECKNTANLYQKLLSMLTSKNRMAQTFGTFQMCCELSSNFDTFSIYHDTSVIRALRRIAVYSNIITSRFAINALIILTKMSDNRVQRFPPKSISEWNEDDVQKWLKIFGFQDYCLFFKGIDGEALMKLSDYDLKNHYFLADSCKRKLFVEERSILGDESSLKMIKSLQEESTLYQSEPLMNNGLSITYDQRASVIDSPFRVVKKKFDVFISYRRQGGSDLASLIFIYLKGKKHRVFFDVQTLRAGRFADKLKNSIQQSKNFILLLTNDALNRCKDEGDWIAVEIEMALKSHCNIIPITRDFDNNAFNDNDLPESIKQIREYNQIHWHHDTQNSCLKKISEYMENRNDPNCPWNWLNTRKRTSHEQS
ncbi:NAD(+) hydrolase sarm1-like isoform X1 [Chironomus tepperi]|uniref:NAD(+) hydrolase sarm1-like isoform X1 n=1 Tax=Chironomus tepperi TaxID=113505 RepID=UPI00391F6418